MLSLHPVAGGFLRGHSHECPLKSFGVGFQRERGIETPLPLAVFCILFWRQKSMPAELSRLKTICIEIEWLLCFAPDFSHTSSIIFKFICLRRHTFLFRKRKVWKRDRPGEGVPIPLPLGTPSQRFKGAFRRFAGKCLVLPPAAKLKDFPGISSQNRTRCAGLRFW